MSTDRHGHDGPLRLAVIGDPIDHSLSPAMQTAALRAAGIDGTYVAMQVAPADLGVRVEALRAEVGGFNVTIPHKQAIVPYLDELAPGAIATAAVNTVVAEAGRLIGHNTDVEGFAAALAALNLNLAEQRVVVFGSGGAARAVVRVLLDGGAQFSVVARSPTASRSPGMGPGWGIDTVNMSSPSVPGLIAAATMIVNATPLGMKHLGTASPLPRGVELEPHTVVFDLVYGRRTPLLLHAQQRGCRAVDGLEMLVQQGAASFRLWTRVAPDLDVMRAACRNQLAAMTSEASLAVPS